MASGSYIMQCSFKSLLMNLTQLQFFSASVQNWKSLGGKIQVVQFGYGVYSWISQLWLGSYSAEMAAEGLLFCVYLRPFSPNKGNYYKLKSVIRWSGGFPDGSVVKNLTVHTGNGFDH